MGQGRLTWEDCLPVVEYEARRWQPMGAAIGLDRDDLAQEASLVAVQCVRRAEGGGSRAYVQRAIRNRFQDVRAKALARKRVPYDADGTPQPGWVQSYDVLSEDNGLPLLGASSILEARHALRILHDSLPADDWDLLVQTMVEGARLGREAAPAQRRQIAARIRDVQRRARGILSRILRVETRGLPMTEPAKIPIPVSEDLSPCHANGADPQGYDRDDTDCHNCPDKFSCLPAALAQGLVVGSISDDREVEAVNDGTMQYRTAIERMKQRYRLLVTGANIPDELSVHYEADAEPTQVRAKPVAVVPEPEPEAKPEPVPEDHAFVPPKAKPPAPKAGKKKVRVPRSALRTAEGVPTMRNGKALPPIRQVTEAKMARALGRVKIGQPFDLQLGMQLVRKTKSGDTIIVKLRPTGFELDGVIYSALSTALMYRLRKVVSGNDYFNLNTNQCTEIWAADGSVLAGYSAS